MLGLLLVLVVTVIFFIDLFAFKNKSNSSTDIPSIKAGSNFLVSNSENDKQFLIITSEINLQQIELGQLAQKKSLNPEINNLGRLMEISLSRFQRTIVALAKKKSINIQIQQNETVKSNYTHLSADAGDVFDISYCDFVILKQKEAITLLNKVVSETTDLEIKQLAISEIPNLNAQLNRAFLCQNNLNKN